MIPDDIRELMEKGWKNLVGDEKEGLDCFMDKADDRDWEEYWSIIEAKNRLRKNVEQES